MNKLFPIYCVLTSSLGREIELSGIERMKFKKVNALHCGDFERSAGEE